MELRERGNFTKNPLGFLLVQLPRPPMKMTFPPLNFEIAFHIHQNERFFNALGAPPRGVIGAFTTICSHAVHTFGSGSCKSLCGKGTWSIIIWPGK